MFSGRRFWSPFGIYAQPVWHDAAALMNNLVPRAQHLSSTRQIWNLRLREKVVSLTKYTTYCGFGYMGLANRAFITPLHANLGTQLEPCLNGFKANSQNWIFTQSVKSIYEIPKTEYPPNLLNIYFKLTQLNFNQICDCKIYFWNENKIIWTNPTSLYALLLKLHYRYLQ